MAYICRQAELGVRIGVPKQELGDEENACSPAALWDEKQAPEIFMRIWLIPLPRGGLGLIFII
jgi:hypothetical protein